MPHLEALIPDGKRKFLTQFYSQVYITDIIYNNYYHQLLYMQTVSPCHELKIPVYSALGAKSIPFEQVNVNYMYCGRPVNRLMVFADAFYYCGCGLTAKRNILIN